MTSGYPAPPVHHQQAYQPDMGGPPPQHPGYHAPLPPPINLHQSNSYYQGSISNPHRANMPPPRANVIPPSIHQSRDRVSEIPAPENGVSTQAQRPAEPEPESQLNLEQREGEDVSGRRYRLEVMQQPMRARMCGFGDKDRRPITPPPCIRVVIMDKDTGKEVDCNEIEHQLYVLHVDLWDEWGKQEVNLVKHSQHSPSISSGHPASFRAVTEGPQNNVFGYQNIVPSNREYPQPTNAPYAAQMTSYPDTYNQGGYPYPPQVQPYGYPQGGYNGGVAPLPSQPMYSPRYSHDMPANAVSQSRAMGQQQHNGMYTRNLIGSLTASASRLQDPNQKIGIWFVLQDLSVRTEGWFRLRFSFVNLRKPDALPPGSGASDHDNLNRSRAPVLVYAFSDKFQVYSAKRFPGVWESTQLSRCFAEQGVKIPIRKGEEKRLMGEDRRGGGDRGSDNEEDLG